MDHDTCDLAETIDLFLRLGVGFDVYLYPDKIELTMFCQEHEKVEGLDHHYIDFDFDNKTGEFKECGVYE